MRILITNDDGFLSRGLRLLYESVRDLPNVEVDIVVPEKPQSAGGLSVTLHKPLRVRKLSLDDVTMYIISGRPCDAVIYALHELGPYDLVLSGVNVGENTSIQAALASGTIAACLYASLIGEACSLAYSADVDFHNIDTEWLRACKHIIRTSVEYAILRRVPPIINVISINFPKKIDKFTRVKVCKISTRKFIHKIIKRIDPRGIEYLWIHGDLSIRVKSDEDTTNVLLLNNITVSGICAYHIDIMHDYDIESIRKARRYLQELADKLNEALLEFYSTQ